MTMNDFAEKLNEWLDSHGWDEVGFVEFVNAYATSYEEYCTMRTIFTDILRGLEAEG